MSRCTGEELLEVLEGLVHAETQVEPHGVTLTVDRVAALDGAAALDFGGGEYVPADRSVLEPQKRDSDDTYGWWELDQGTYLVSWNESVCAEIDARMFIDSWTHARDAGVMHPRSEVSISDDPIKTLIHVPADGLAIKENARLSILRGTR